MHGHYAGGFMITHKCCHCLPTLNFLSLVIKLKTSFHTFSGGGGGGQVSLVNYLLHSVCS